jgi:3-methyladenine DNA glycosylase AlkD
LVSITDGGFEIAWNTSLSSLNLSALETVYDTLSIAGILLTSLDLGSLATAIVNIHDNPNLTDITLTNFVPTNDTKNYFSENALSAATVNAILARFVANAAFVTGVIDLSGGTNAAPTGQGLTDVTTLLARGVTVTVTE